MPAWPFVAAAPLNVDIAVPVLAVPKEATIVDTACRSPHPANHPGGDAATLLGHPEPPGHSSFRCCFVAIHPPSLRSRARTLARALGFRPQSRSSVWTLGLRVGQSPPGASPTSTYTTSSSCHYHSSPSLSMATKRNLAPVHRTRKSRWFTRFVPTSSPCKVAPLHRPRSSAASLRRVRPPASGDNHGARRCRHLRNQPRSIATDMAYVGQCEQTDGRLATCGLNHE